MLIGPHAKKLPTPDQNKEQAKAQKWGVFQTHWGSPRTLKLANKLSFEGNTITDGPLWSLHCSYLAQVNATKLKDVVIGYVKSLCNQAKIIGANYIVIHVGKTKDQTPEEVTAGAKEFCDKIDPYLIELDGPLLLIENVAAKYEFNQDLNHITNLVSSYKKIEWCLDLHHSFAAGVTFEEQMLTLRNAPPTLVHANYPGSDFGSGLDRHGWFSQPQVFTDDSQRESWCDTVKYLIQEKIPIVLEGGSTEGDLEVELEAVRNLARVVTT